MRIAVRDGMPLFGKKVLSPNFKEREDAESFEINCHVCLRPSFEYGNEHLFFTDTWTKEEETVN